MRILLATFPFGQADGEVRDILLRDGHTLIENPYGRRLRSGEVGQLIADCDAVIAGTEPYQRDELSQSLGKLKLISRVGVGLDSIDLNFCKKHGIHVAYTPDAPTQAVAELTIHHMLSLCRNTFQSHRSVIDLSWKRQMGSLLSERKIGILGLGRIGKRTCKLLQPFGVTLWACDILPDVEFSELYGIKLCSHDELFSACDLISIHIPLNEQNYHFVGHKYLRMMSDGSLIVNTSRGPVIDEGALIACLQTGKLKGAALDVFSREPYMGPLRYLPNVILSAHIGASTRATRRQMELGAAKAVIAFSRSQLWNNYVI